MLTESHLKTPRKFGLGVNIVCSITATTEPTSSESVPVISPEKFLGIRALNSSSHVHITNQMVADVYYELTVPFGCPEGHDDDSHCYLDATLFIPQTSTTCNKPDIIHSNSEVNSCGLRFYRSDVGKPKKLQVQPKFPTSTVQLSQPMTLVLTTVENEAHLFFSDYSVDKMQVTVSTDQTVLNNKYCYAVCDPHMFTFDGLPYENQNAGTFDLYIHQEYNQRVQIETKSCSNNGRSPYCVCGVAVQAGSDVFVLSTCNNRLLDVRFVQCGDRILQQKVNEISKTHYRVTLPSGTYVDIHLVGDFMNVYVYPSVADFKKTSGLCGLFDGTTNNDRLNRPGSNDSDPNISWMVKEPESLFNENVGLLPWEDRYRFCTCNERNSNKPVNIATCDATLKKTCDAKPMFTDRCVNKRRKRRDANGIYRPTDEGDLHKTVQLAFVSNNQDSFMGRKKRSIKHYTEETARQDCMQLMNTTAFQRCSKCARIRLHIDNKRLRP
ncbi:von Willebrand factor D and EGF domain-containing protein-like [Dreissena polymorpha]|uniref:von Willebrand factor D and EGF domain-containing protein-like n=1 Tax=Dreissena polymorpha TaxID=45954 RepID=UPI002265168B|nr:von Willebrand factor D and EGF domain-containing protein-like [Dreissena polymorpha]